MRQHDGRILVQRVLVIPQADPRPKGPATGKRVDGCYAACLDDCDGELEQEHFISHRMLKLLAGQAGRLHMRGIDPKDPELARWVTPKNVTAPVLCKRHNHTLKPIDTAGNNFFETIMDLRKVLDEAPPGTKRIVPLNGHDLERWGIKALCGFLARAGKPVDELWVRILFGRGSTVRPRGLYVYAGIGDVLRDKGIGLSTVLQHGNPVGVIAHLSLHELVFSVHPSRTIGVDGHEGKWCVYRPSCFAFENPANGSTLELWLSWQDDLYHGSIDVTWNGGSANEPTTSGAD